MCSRTVYCTNIDKTVEMNFPYFGSTCPGGIAFALIHFVDYQCRLLKRMLSASLSHSVER